MSLSGWIIVLLAAAYVAFHYRRYRHAGQDQAREYEVGERRFMPLEIAEGELVLSEKTLRTRTPAQFVARVDQVYLTRAGYLVPCETKTRHFQQITGYDVVELSVQSFVMQYSRSPNLPQAKIADWGYVRIVAPGRNPKYLRTKLLNEHEVLALRARREDLLAGRLAPDSAANPKVCNGCAYRDQCHHQQH